MGDAQTFGTWSLLIACLTVSVAEGHRALLMGALWAGESAAWLAILISGICALALYWPVARYLSMRVRGNLINLAGAAAGVPGEIAMGILIGGLCVFQAGYTLRQTAEMAVSAVYPHTPQTFAMVTLLLCSGYCAYGGLAAAVRCCRVFLPVLVVGILAVCGGTLGWAQIDNLFPILGTGLTTLLGRSLMLTTWLWPLILLLYTAPPELRDLQRLCRKGALAIGLAVAIYAVIMAQWIMVFSVPVAHSVIFPMYQLSRLVIGGRFFERIDGLWVSCWAFGTACHVGVIMHIAAKALAQAFGAPDHRSVLLPVVVMTVSLGIFPHDVYQTVAPQRFLAPVVLAAGFALPLLLTLLAAWRSRERPHHAY